MDKDQQELMFKLSMYEQQIQQLQQQLQAIEQSIVEMTSLNIGLDELVGSKGKEIMAPLGRGIFARTKLVSEDLTVDIGEKNLVKKSIPDTKKIIEEQINKLEEVKTSINNSLDKLSEELTKTMMEAQQKQEKKK